MEATFAHRVRLAGLCGVAIATFAASEATAQMRRYAIRTQPLATALREFGTQSGQTVLVDDGLANGKTSPGYSGSSDPETALRSVLSGTGLSYRRQGDVFVVVGATKGATSQIDPASTAPAPTAGASPNDIVVTAQRRREAIQDVPIAISAFTQESLDKQKIEGGPDLLKAVPNLTFSKSNFAGYNLEIRGIGTKAISVTTDPGVAVDFNSTTLLTNRFFEQEFFDLERVEVLRGPQGTLYGRNATGGVVNIISHKADLDKLDGYVKGELGNFSSKRAQGAVNIPIIPDLFGIRIAGAWTKRDGFTTNDITSHRIDGRNLYTTRLTASLKPSSRLRSDVVWERFSENDNRARTAKQLCHRDPGVSSIGSIKNISPAGSGYLSQGCKDGSLYDDAAYGVPNGLSLAYVQVGQDQFFGKLGNDLNPPAGQSSIVTILKPGIDPYASTTQTHDLRRISSISDPIYRAKANVVEWNTSWDFAPGFALTSQTAYNQDRYYSNQDYNRFNTVPLFNSSDGLIDDYNAPSPAITPRGVYNDPQLGPSNRLVVQDLVTARTKQFSQELRISTTGQGPFQGTVGGNYTYYKNKTDYFIFFNVLSAILQGPEFYLGNRSADPKSCAKFYFDGTSPHLYPVPVLSPEGNARNCIYIDPHPLASIDGQGHNYFRSSNRFHLNSYGIFFDGTYALTSNVKLIGGIRYNDDAKTSTPVPSQLALSTASFLGGTVNYGYPTLPDINQHFRAFTGRAGVQWTPHPAFTNASMIYFTYSRGYKAGGTNPPGIGYSTAPVAPGSPPLIDPVSYPETFKPEYVNSLEIGTKNTLLGNRLTVNLTAYYYDFSNYQVSQIIARSATNENFNTKMYGLEGEFVYKPSRAIALNANFGLQNAELDKHQYSLDVMDRLQGHDDYVVAKPFVILPSNCVVRKEIVEQIIADERATGFGDEINLVSVCPGSQFSRTFGQTLNDRDYPNGGRGFYADVGGNQVPNAPHFTVNVGAEYNIPVARDWVVTPRIDFYHQAGSYARVYNDAIDRLRGWENVNLSLRVGNPKLGILVEAYVKNLFDDTPITDAFINSDDTGLTTNVFTFDPRIIGVNISKKF